jgi:hypothetical protein
MFSACTFLACSRNCLPISFNSSAFFFLRYLLGDFELLCCISTSAFSFFLRYSFTNSWDLSLPIMRWRFYNTFIISSSLRCSFSIATQSSFSLSSFTSRVTAIFSSSFSSLSYSFLSFSSYSLSFVIYFSIRFMKVFSIWASSLIFIEFWRLISSI